jgi:hypothetical protein
MCKAVAVFQFSRRKFASSADALHVHLALLSSVSESRRGFVRSAVSGVAFRVKFYLSFFVQYPSNAFKRQFFGECVGG